MTVQLKDSGTRHEARDANEATADDARGIVIGFIGAKGGVGTTTLAVNTAAALAQGTGEQVCAVDYNFRGGDVATFLAVEPSGTVTELFRHPSDDEAITAALSVSAFGVAVLSAPVTVEEAEEAELRATAAGRLLMRLKGLFRTVTVDLGSRLTESVLFSAEACDRIFVVCEPMVPAVRAATRVLDTIGKIPGLAAKTTVLLNRCGGCSRIEPKAVEKALGVTFCRRVGDAPAEVASAINRGEPVVRASPRCAASVDILRLAERLVPGKGVAQGRGFMARIRSAIARHP